MLAGPQSKSDGTSPCTDTYTLADASDAVPVAYEQRASEHLLQMTSALAYDGSLYVLGATIEAPYRVFSATEVDTFAQPGDYVAPGPEPEPDPDPDPDPSPGSDSDSESEDSGTPEVPADESSDKSSNASGAASNRLASTGDASPIVSVVLVCGGAACALLVSLKARREKKTRL